MHDSIMVGAHRAWVEGDVMRVVHVGPVTIPELEVLYRQLGVWNEERGVWYLLIDIQAMPPPEPEVRKWMAKPKSSAPIRAVLAVGASPAVRVISTLLTKAMELLGNKPGTPFMMMKSEAEAQAWIQSDRSRR